MFTKGQKGKSRKMNDVLVTIRIPEAMLQELRKAAQHDHFMDISEAVRNIIRKNWAASSDPYLYELRKLREEISAGVKEKSRKMAERMIVEELKKIKRVLKDEKA